MRLAFFSDAHGNIDALTAVLNHARSADMDAAYFLGDALGYLPQAAAVLDLLAASDVVCIKGNHEAMILGELPLDPAKDQFYGLERVKASLTSAHLETIRAWPRTLRLHQDGLTVQLVHGAPDEPLTHYLYPDEDFGFLADYDAAFLICGHTHRPFLLSRHGTIVVNAGSCGLPRDNGLLAAYAMLDTASRAATIYRVPYVLDPALLALLPSQIQDCLARRAPCPMTITLGTDGRPEGGT